MRNTLVIGVLLAGGLSSLAEAPLTPKQLEFFEKNIRPVLATQCYSCHSAAEGKDKGGLTLDTRDALRKGGDSGEVVQLWLWLGGEGFFCGGKGPCGIAAAQLSF